MSLNDFLALVTQVTLVVIAGLTLANYIGRRDPIRLDIALMFGALAYIVIAQRLQDVPGISDDLNRWLAISTQMALMAHPYLLLRLVLDFRPVPKTVWGVAFIGMILSWAILLALSPTLPQVVIVALVIYFFYIEMYSALAFVRGAMITTGVTRWRLTLAASGSGLLALVILGAGLSAIWPLVAPVISTINQFWGLFAMFAYYAGFATPHWLRRYWQLSELQRFLRQTAGPWAGEPTVSTLERLCRITMRAVGGLAAMVVLWDEQEKQFMIHASTNATALPSGQVVNSEAIWRSWEMRTPIMGYIPADFTAEQTPIAVTLGANATMIVPIMTQEHAWGILQLFNRRKSLFAADDLSLLTLFAEQTGIALGYATLLTGQQKLIHQLGEQTTQLEYALKELESFSYSVSHDLRSPLRHISGFIELLQKHSAASLDEKGLRYTNIILDEARRMGILIDDLLAFSRFSRTELHQTDVDFTQLVQEVMADFAQELQGRDVTWHIQPLPLVQGDRSMLRLVLSNLISNALKFSRERSQTRIEIGSKQSQDEVIFFIYDNGTGFDMQYAGQLFGVFQRLHKVTEFEGTGIGLATVRRIIQRHGGRTWAESIEGQEATFYFTFPLERSVPEESSTILSGTRKDEDDGGSESD
jgi:signal transduction histidine kinase